MPDNEPTPNQSTTPPASPTPPPAPTVPVPTQPATAPPAPPATPNQTTAAAGKKKGSIWKWVILYGIVAAILYSVVFLLFMAGHSSGTTSSMYNY